MKAITRSGYLTPTLSFATNHPLPSFDSNANPDLVKIKVIAASINPIDYKIKPIAKLAFPVVGFDVSGIVEEVGSNVKSLRKGDPVFGQASEGSLAEYVLAKENCLAKKPDGISFQEAAALPVAYVVAYLGFRQNLKLQKDPQSSQVLIIGASGGCGIAALQLAKALSISRIVAICSHQNTDLVKEHGATEVIDYTQKQTLQQFWSQNQNAFDCIYDAASFSGGGEDYTTIAMSTLNNTNAKYVQLNGKGIMWAKKMTNMLPENVYMPLVSHSMNSKSLAEMVSLLDVFKARPIVIPMPFTNEGFQQGFDLLKSRRTKGKIVYQIADL